jgi:catechol 2,3-dioxygenase-like lactoylglutathione lyase family enzyme
LDIYRISAVTLKVRDMQRSCDFYSRLPGFNLVRGGADAHFTTFEVGEGTRVSVNLELSTYSDPGSTKKVSDFGRIIFYTWDVDSLFKHLTNDAVIARLATMEGDPADAPWGERFFHLREPDGYQLSFAQPIIKNKGRK